MTDNTPGTRDEKHTAADFATAKFARDPGGDATAHRTPMGFWTSRTFHGIDDEAMALGGWSPVRECPDPDKHDDVSRPLAPEVTDEMVERAFRATFPHPAATVSEPVIREMLTAALDAAPTTDGGIGYDGDYWHARWAEQHERADKAERERDEADRRTAEAEEQRDQWKRHHDRVDGQWAKAEREVTKLRLAAESRPLTPDAVNARVERAEDAFYRARRENRPDALRLAVLAALTEPPKRPEGAEEIEGVLRTLDDPDGPVAPPVLNDAQFIRLADLLASRGVRVVGEDGAV